MSLAPRPLAGQTAFVSGSTAGIGLAIAQALLADGAHVIINGRSEASVLRVGTLTGLVVLIMTWIVAPQLTRVMKPWLHAGHKH